MEHPPGGAGELGYFPGVAGEFGYSPGEAGELGYSSGEVGELGYSLGKAGKLCYKKHNHSLKYTLLLEESLLMSITAGFSEKLRSSAVFVLFGLTIFKPKKS